MNYNWDDLQDRIDRLNVENVSTDIAHLYLGWFCYGEWTA